MANPTADYPTTLHTATDASAFVASKLGSTTPTHTDLEGKQEEEIVAIQTKIGIGVSTPSIGKVLTGTGDGTSDWADLPAGGTGDMKADGSVDFTAVVAYNGDKTFTTDQDIVSKKYVDDSIVAAGGYTDEQAQDAVGAMVDTTLTYVDATPQLKVTNPVTPQATGFTITAGTTPKTLTVSDTASVTGTNTGDNATNSQYSGLATTIAGKENFHGVASYAGLAWSDANHTVTLSAITYWYKGVSYSTASTVTCDLDLTADRDNSANTLTTNKLYYIYFKDATGKLYWSDSSWSFKENVFVATVFWNGTNGALQAECHNHTRDLDWHIWAHDTIGTRYESGFTLTAPTTVADSTLNIGTGTIHDEDQDYATGAMTTMRGWYMTSSTVSTFGNYSLPYLGTTGQPQYLDTDTYTLTNVGATDYVCMWVYASLDITRPLYIIPTHASTAHNTIAAARVEAAPNLPAVNSEYKLIYRFIYKGDGEFQESADYRLTTPVPSGGVPSTTAGAVSFIPTGNVASTNVQSAIAEVDSEKAPADSPTFTTKITGSYLTASEIVVTNASKEVVSAPVATYPSLTELSYVKGVTSALQTQINAKAPTGSPSFTGTVTMPTGLTGILRADAGVVSTDSDVTDIVSAASDTAAGKIEIATAAETTTGTDATRAVSPDGLAGSDYGKRMVGIQVFDSATDVATGDGKAFFRIPSTLNGYNLVGVAMSVYTAGTTNTTDVQIRNVTDSVDMLSTKLTIDSAEVDTSTAATAAVIDTTKDDVATGDRISIDVDATSTTKAKGLYVELVFALP